ncbi:hypothetical protein [Amycolatopsis lurida]|uniref:hypothetical protein n=1 Tax=Amycolatopsis lurida TaxID=31959 RepID=UPI000ACC22C6|nr:hypothetical protein [Amycolatopsis lurida]
MPASCLWPETLIDTAALALLGLPHEHSNGRAFIEVGVTDLSRYGDANAHKDIFVD